MNDPLEKEIERKVCEYAKSKGILVYKFSSPGMVSVPDRLLILPCGLVFFIEFKRSGCKPTPKQLREHQRLQAQNVKVFVIDNVEDGKNLINGIT